MKFELIGKHRATVVNIDILSLKMGQVDVLPAVCLTFKVPLPNAKLSMLGDTLRDFLYENSGPKSREQATLEGVEVVSDKPNLTAAAMALGDLTWEYEQTGCKLVIYNGATGHGDIKLTDGTVRKMKLSPKEGGTVDHVFQFYTGADVDAETIGELGVLKSLERDIELTVPEILSQQTLDEADDEPEQPAGPANPLEAMLTGSDAPPDAPDDTAPPSGSWPLPTTSHEEQKPDVPVTTKRRRKVTAPA